MDRVVEADIDTAEAVGEVVKAGEIDLGEIVDGLAGQIADRADGRLAPGLPPGALEFRAIADALVDQLLLGLKLGQSVGFLDLDVAVALDTADRDIVVTGIENATT